MFTSDFPKQVVERDFGNREVMQRFADGWRKWKEAEDGWFVMVHSEIVCHKAT